MSMGNLKSYSVVVSLVDQFEISDQVLGRLCIISSTCTIRHRLFLKFNSLDSFLPKYKKQASNQRITICARQYVNCLLKQFPVKLTVMIITTDDIITNVA